MGVLHDTNRKCASLIEEITDETPAGTELSIEIVFDLRRKLMGVYLDAYDEIIGGEVSVEEAGALLACEAEHIQQDLHTLAMLYLQNKGGK